MRNSPANDAFCSTREAAELLGVALRTVQVWVENGTLPAWKTAGGHRRIARSSLNELLSQRSLIAGPTVQAASVQNQTGQLNILVIDDEIEIIRLYELQMTSWDLPINLVTASNGFQGLVQLGHVTPHILILDLAMPGMDGFQLLQSVRNMPQNKNMQIIVVSGMSAAEIKKHGGLPTDVRVLRKPIQFPLLRQIAEERCEREGIRTSARSGKQKAAQRPAGLAAAAAAKALDPKGRPWKRRATDR